MPYATLFRSEEVSAVQLYFPSELARSTVSALGELGCVQFRDLNAETSAFQRSFVKDVRRVDEIERQLRFFGKQIETAGIQIAPLDYDNISAAAPTVQEVDELAERTRHYEERINSLNGSHETLQRRYVELIELRHVLKQTGGFFDQAHQQTQSILPEESEEVSLLDNAADMEQQPADGSLAVMNIGFVSGVIPRARTMAMERILWRILRGNLYMSQVEIDEPINDPVTNEPVDKNVFTIFAHGKEILAKVRKITESLGATLYQVDENPRQRREQLTEVNSRIGDIMSVLQNTRQTAHAELRYLAANVNTWMVLARKEKVIYQTMNLFNYDSERKCLIAEGWCPTNDLHKVQNCLRISAENSGALQPSIMSEIHTVKTPPTFMRTNKFTQAFQSIMDAYGIATYREVNPGLIAIVTFPFLFAIMFGDLGHGFFLLCAALYLVLNEKKLARAGREYGEIFDMAYYGRYIMLLMGIYSMYTGLVYNDIFSKSMNLFGSQWKFPEDSNAATISGVQTGTYAFGLDPAWEEADNGLLFSNSLKMKLSVCIGVIHMTFSLCLSLINHRFFKSKLDIVANFIPGMLFLCSIFVYLVICIIYKWSVDWSKTDAQPPSLLNMLIYMFLSPGTVEEPLYPGQAQIQVVLLLIALVCVPWMLLMKPLVLRREHNKARDAGYQGVALNDNTRISHSNDDDDDEGGGVVIAEQMHEEEEFDFGEIMIHQVIHTIEFCLNCVSHTASYLRLWALSLAHNQLSKVLWSMTLENAFATRGPLGVVMLTASFTMWLVLTISVLVVMEGTSAMLHSLRLHWVEAASKHFEANGQKFEPMTFEF
ncbi:V-type ATPase, V0 complex, 116kDa subunit family [Protomyces lactucae-debilis]|uniref:V-type proton ATPase subunit a n=1 Tax=Protomyces lactucae-debilis TaxID=2754530 RepID=A0A1Y2F2V2_PROLT|nr:V-type ATPase, V0 complex, 116kDa subunit family [Protomyces lactucae-debilis]ORY77295.1 V-type ATPase, V0 complex, 116kDa subunit family [Protomyces lactucae-debilis]